MRITLNDVELSVAHWDLSVAAAALALENARLHHEACVLRAATAREELAEKVKELLAMVTP